MIRLRELAAATADEIQTDRIGDGTHEFADYVNKQASNSMSDIDLATWRKAANKCGEHLTCDADLYLWIRGVGGEASLLLLPRQEQIGVSRLRENVLKVSLSLVAAGE